LFVMWISEQSHARYNKSKVSLSIRKFANERAAK
jgi:hypothetical protein